METAQPLERLHVLESKIAHVIDLLHAEKERSSQLLQEKNQLAERLEAMESSLQQESQSSEELAQERVRTKQMVDELIKTIDHLVDGTQQQAAL